MAISAKYTKTLIDRQFIANEAEQTANDIIDIQLPIAKNKGWTRIVKNLSSRPFTVVQSGRGVVLTFNYLTLMRFMDMRKDRYGNEKPDYTPIYNKHVFGLIYGYLYKRLVAGIGKDLNEAIVQQLTNAGYKLG